MNSWEQSLREHLRDDFVARGDESCLYAYCKERTEQCACVSLKRAFAEGADGWEIMRLIAALALNNPKLLKMDSVIAPFRDEALNGLGGSKFGDLDRRGKIDFRRRIMGRLREWLDGTCEETPPSRNELEKAADELCSADPLRNTKAVKAWTARIEELADDAMAHGASSVDPSGYDAEPFRKALDKGLTEDAKQMLRDWGVPTTTKTEPQTEANGELAPSRKAGIPVKLVQMCLRERGFDDLLPGVNACRLGDSSASGAVSTRESACTDADVALLADAVGESDVVVPVAFSEPMLGLVLCVMGAVFAETNNGEYGGKLKRWLGERRERPFCAVLPANVLGGPIFWGAAGGDDDAYFETDNLIGLFVEAWPIEGARGVAPCPVTRFKNFCESRQGSRLQKLRTYNDVAPEGCPERLTYFFDSDGW